MSDASGVAATREQVVQRILGDRRFVLATHENPDGDALGSLVAMRGLLAALGKEVVMFIAPEDLPVPREYRALSLERLISAPPEDISQRTVIFLDCGNIDRSSARVLRDGTVIYDTTVESLRRFSEDVREVSSGFECGIVLANFQDVHEGDVLETYETRLQERVLSA